MRKYFVVSLVWHGVLGGGIVADEEAMTYHTGKTSVPEDIRRIVMRYEDMAHASEERLFGLPVVRITMKNGDAYRFVTCFCRKRMMALLRGKGAG